METIKKLAEKSGKKLEDIKALLQDIYQQEKALFPNESDEKLKERAVRIAICRLKGEIRKQEGMKEYQGILIGDGGIIDAVKKAREVALNLFAKDPRKAIELGYVDVNGNPLDRRQGSLTFGKPLPKELILRNIYAMTKNEDKAMLTRITIRNNVNGDVPLFTPVTFRARPSKEQRVEGWLTLNSNEVNFEHYNGMTDDVFNYLLKSIPTIAVSEIPSWLEKVKEAPPFKRFTGVVGDVVSVEALNNGLYRIFISDVDTVDSIPMFYRSPVNFGAESRIFAFCRVASGRLGGPVLSGLGIYPLEIRNPPSEIKPGQATCGPTAEVLSEEEIW